MSEEPLDSRLTSLLAWAIETQRKAPTVFYENYYSGYSNAIKDVLAMLGKVGMDKYE